MEGQGFKKVRRVAHAPKIVQPKKRKTSKKKKDSDSGNLSFAFFDDLEPPKLSLEVGDDILNSSRIEYKLPPVLVACGTVTNTDRLEAFGAPSFSSVSYGDYGDEFRNDVKPVLRIKLGEEDSRQLRKLRGTSKPDRYNEDILFTKCYSAAFRNQICKCIGCNNSKPCRRSSEGTKKKEENRIAVATELAKKLHVDSWTLDSAAPEWLEKIHEKNFGLHEGEVSKINPPPKILIRPNKTVMDWDEFLGNADYVKFVPPVTYFKHAPLVNLWKEIAVPGLAIELRNVFLPAGEHYWFATIIHFAGYRALAKFEDFSESSDRPYLTWFSFCSDVPKPLGWAQENGKSLRPGPIIPHRKFSRAELKSHIEEFSSRPTISQSHAEMLRAQFSVVRQHWNVNLPVEALDPSIRNQNRLARIAAIAGDRVQLLFSKEPTDKDDYFSDGFWYHYRSEDVHPLMWSHTVGVNIVGGHPSDFCVKLSPEHFPTWPSDKVQVKTGMKFEARHPTEPQSLVAAHVVEVFEYGYFLAETLEKDSYTRYRSLFHVTSPYVLPLGFGKRHGIDIDHKPDFYDNAETCALAVDQLPPRPSHKFKVGLKIEAFDEIDLAYMGPATIQKIAGHLLLIHFDGWKKSIAGNYQWMDAESPDICPPGYAQLCGFFFQGPVMPPEEIQ